MNSNCFYSLDYVRFPPILFFQFFTVSIRKKYFLNCQVVSQRRTANDHMKIFNLSTNEKLEECSVTWKCPFHIFNKWGKKEEYVHCDRNLFKIVYVSKCWQYLSLCSWFFQMTFNFLLYTYYLNYVSFLPLFFYIFQFPCIECVFL